MPVNLGLQTEKMARVRYTRAEYRNLYLRSKEWRDFRSTILTSQPKCQTCEARATDLNHLIYRGDVHAVSASDVLPLCRVCHNRVHDAINMRLILDPGRMEPSQLNEARLQVLALTKDQVVARRRYLRQKAFIKATVWASIHGLHPYWQQILRGVLKVSSLDAAHDSPFSNSVIEKVEWFLSFCATPDGNAQATKAAASRSESHKRSPKPNYLGKTRRSLRRKRH